MGSRVFTPKQIAQALGVSESSVKRWVDSGRLAAAKTAGGHRRVTLSAIASFVRETGHEMVDPTLLGMVNSARDSLSSSSTIDELLLILIQGRELACRELILGFYQRGDSIAAIGDKLIGPTFQQIGLGWAAGEIQIFEERRACEVMIATLHELRRWLPPAEPDAPFAMVATPFQDFSMVPARLIELVLISAGWRVQVAGSALPLRAICDAVRQQQPQLFCLSATHLDDADEFVDRANRELIRPLRAIGGNRSHGDQIKIVIGGGALAKDEIDGLECDLFAYDLASLVSFQSQLRKARA